MTADAKSVLAARGAEVAHPRQTAKRAVCLSAMPTEGDFSEITKAVQSS